MADDAEVTEALPTEVAFTLSWEAAGGTLHGILEGRNVSDHPVRLSHKPGLIPIGVDGEPLDAETIVTAELRLPDYAEMGPGERARATVSWAGWGGPPASGRVIVKWSGGQVEVAASGPRQPTASGPTTNLSSSWFTLID